jgi:hypothetical protein
LDPNPLDEITGPDRNLKRRTVLDDLSGAAWRFLGEFAAIDEFWLYGATDHERIWLGPGATTADKRRQIVESPKFALTIILRAI